MLEAFIDECEGLRRALTRGWRPRSRASPLGLGSSQAQVSRARTACAMLEPHPEVRALLERARKAEDALSHAADEALAGCRIVLEASVHQKLRRLEELAQPIDPVPGEYVLCRSRVDGGALTVTQSRVYFEDDSRVFSPPPGDPVLRARLVELVLRLRDELGVSGPPAREPGLCAIVEAFRFDQDPKSSPGLLLCWREGVLFLPHHKTGDLLTVVLRPRLDEPAVDATDREVLEAIGLMLPWAEREIFRRLEDAGVDWCWRRADFVVNGSTLLHTRYELPAYRVMQGEQLLREAFDR